MKSIILCADDFAQNPAISQGILNLISQHRLSATSCMTNSIYWPEHAELLKPYANQIAIGLHFNLTEGKALSAMPSLAPNKQLPSLSTLLLKSLTRQINFNEIENELNFQIDQFEKSMKQLPDFIDGHQHVHQLPIIRDVVIKIYNERFKNQNVYIRCASEKNILSLLNNPAKFKRFIIYISGGAMFKRQLQNNHIPYNTSFSGFYNFDQSEDYAKFFPRFLSSTDENGLIMCHPGLKNDDRMDTISKSRYDEYSYFMSDAFLKACRDAGVILKKGL